MLTSFYLHGQCHGHTDLNNLIACSLIVRVTGIQVLAEFQQQEFERELMPCDVIT
jgi:hypothetical protein